MGRLTTAVVAAFLFAFVANAGEIPGLTSKKLANGLEVIVVENHGSPLVTVEVAVRAGSFVEAPEYSGLSHLYEHLFFKGNRVLPNQEKYLARLGELGASWNGTTQTERVNYFLTVPSENAREATAFIRDALLYPLFDQKELERERVVVLGEFDRNEANPFFHFQREVDRKLWYGHFSRKNVIGDREMIVTTPREKMTLIKERYYIPNNAALLFAGDIRPADAYALAEEMFGDWKPAPDPAKAYPVPAHPPLKQSSTLAILQPVKTAALRLAWHGPSMTGDVSATFAADVLSFILSQPNSRFSKNLIDSGLFDNVSLSYFSQEHTGPISLQGATTPEKLDAAYAAVQKELAAMPASDYFTDEELAFAKKQLEYSELFGREQTSNFIHTVSFWWSSAGLDYYRNYLDNLRAVTRKDIRDYLQRYVIGKPNVTGVLLSEEQLPKVAMLKKAEVIRPKSGTSGTAMSSASVPAVVTEEFDVDGTQVILRRNPQSEVVTAKMFYKGGTAFAGAARAGLESLALEVAARETEHYPKETMARELTRLGAQLSNRAARDFTEFTLTSVAANFADSARIFLDAVAHPKFTETEVRLARERRLNDLSREEDDPDTYLENLAMENAYGSHPYALNTLGTKAVVAAISPEQLRKFYKDGVTRSRLLLVVAGNTTQEQVTDLVRRGLGNLPKGEFKAAALPPLPNAGESSLKLVARDLPTVYVQGLFAGPRQTDPDFVATRIAATALGKKLWEEIRSKRNLSYAPGAWLVQGSLNVGALYVSTPDPNAAVAVIRDEVKRMRTTPLPPAELAAAVNQIRTGLLQRMETSEGTAAMLGSMELSAGDWRLIDELPERLQRTTAEEVRAAMEKWAHHVDFTVLGKVDGLDRKLLESF
jgi:zinc protease